MSADETKDTELLKVAVQSLGEHFDSVQIFATRHESGERNGTVCVNQGTGNWYARYGYVKEWITMEEEVTRAKVRKDDD